MRKEKRKYESCPWCDSKNIIYIDVYSKEYPEHNPYLGYPEEELKKEYSRQKQDGRLGVCLSCNMEFREYIDPKMDNFILNATRISIEEYRKRIEEKILTVPTDSKAYPFVDMLRAACFEKTKHLKVYFQEALEEDLKGIDIFIELSEQIKLK